MSEEFIKEVDEDIKEEKRIKLWKKLIPYVISFSLTIILFTSGFVFWKNYTRNSNQTLGDDFTAAVDLANEDDTDAALLALDRIVDKGSDGYATIAKMKKASLLIDKGLSDEGLSIYLDLERISKEDFTYQLTNLSAFKKVINFEESFIDIIPGDILSINLFGNNFQKEIKTVEKSNSNKVITTKSLDNENESFLVIGNELAFGKFHFNGKVFLLNRNENLTYIVDTSEADLEIPQFSEEDYSLEKK